MLCGVVLCLPMLALGLHSDDFHVLVNVARDPLDGFRFERGTAEALERRGWWLPGAGHLHFFRPLSSLTHWLDLRLWPEAVVVMRLHSIAWYVLLVLSVFAVYRRLLGSTSAASLACLLYAVDGAHAQSVGWIASRNTVIATLFGVVTLWLHDRGRRDGHRASAVLAPLALLGSLLSGEIGASSLAYLLAYELVLGTDEPLRRVVRLVPYGAVAAAWWAYHVAHGYGADQSLWYRDVSTDPIGLIGAMLSRVPLYLATQATLPIVGVAGAAVLPALLVALGVLWLLYSLMWPRVRGHAVARFFLLGAALSALPLGTTRAQDRLATFVAIGVTAVVALWLDQAGKSAAGARTRGYRVMRGLHLFWRPLLFVLFPFALARIAGGDELALEAALPRDTDHGAVLINPPASFMTEQPLVIRKHYGRTPPRYSYALYAGRDRVSLRRVDARTLELRGESGLLFSGLGLQEAWRFTEGDRRQRKHMWAEVEEVDADGAPTAVRFHFDRELRQDAPVLLAWQGGKLGPVPMLSVGESRSFSGR